MTKAKLKVEGLHCASCALSVDDRLEELPGVKQASTSFRRGQTKIQFDEQEVSLDAITAAVAELGYGAEPA